MRVRVNDPEPPTEDRIKGYETFLSILDDIEDGILTVEYQYDNANTFDVSNGWSFSVDESEDGGWGYIHAVYDNASINVFSWDMDASKITIHPLVSKIINYVPSLQVLQKVYHWI